MASWVVPAMWALGIDVQRVDPRPPLLQLTFLSPAFLGRPLGDQIESVSRCRQRNPGKLREFQIACLDGVIPLAGVWLSIRHFRMMLRIGLFRFSEITFEGEGVRCYP